MVRSERFPARGCRSNERATGSGPACPYLRKLSSKALLYRCAVSPVGCCGAGDCRRRPRTPWSSKCAGQPMWWAREELNLRLLPCQIHRGFRYWNSRPLGIVRNLAHDSPWFVCARTGPSGRRLLPVCCRWWTLDSFDTSMCRGRVVSHHVAASAGFVLGGRAAEAPPPAAARARRRMSVTCSASQGGRGSCATRACSCSRTWSNRLFGPCVASSTDR